MVHTQEHYGTSVIVFSPPVFCLVLCHNWLCICVFVYLCICVFVYLCIVHCALCIVYCVLCVLSVVHFCICVFVYLCIYVHVYLCTCVFVYLHICVFVYLCIEYCSLCIVRVLSPCRLLSCSLPFTDWGQAWDEMMLVGRLFIRLISAFQRVCHISLILSIVFLSFFKGYFSKDHMQWIEGWDEMVVGRLFICLISMLKLHQEGKKLHLWWKDRTGTMFRLPLKVIAVIHQLTICLLTRGNWTFWFCTPCVFERRKSWQLIIFVKLFCWIFFLLL